MNASDWFPASLPIVAATMQLGADTHVGDWCNYPPAFHIARALKHLRLLEDGDATEPHLVHATARLLMALEASEK